MKSAWSWKVMSVVPQSRWDVITLMTCCHGIINNNSDKKCDEVRKTLGRCWDEVEKKPGRTRRRTRTKIMIASSQESEYEMTTCGKRYTTQVMNQSLAIMGNTSRHQRQNCTNAHGWSIKRANLVSEHAMSIFLDKGHNWQAPVKRPMRTLEPWMDFHEPPGTFKNSA